MHPILAALLAVCALLAPRQVAAQAPAQRPPAVAPGPALSENAKALLGSWEFSNSDRDKICTVTLKADAAPGGFKVEFDDRCAGAFALVSNVVSWRLTDNDLLRLLDASGKSVAEFSEVEGGIYEAPTPGYGVLFLQAAASVAPPPQSVEQVAGDWTLQRGSGKPLCALTLTTNEIGDDGFALRIAPGCDAAVTRFNPVAWRMDRGELVITAKNGETWRFEDNEGAWRRIPVHADGFVLLKK